ncbi:MAG: aminotransferase class V-fold PLP-dependent enzyme [Bacteroidetes bacterium]|nr:aminotransferase class V-fold PLP-dependent enzyme [Bacteroidota bacterium]
MYTRKTFLKQAAVATAGLSLLDWMEPVQAAAWQKQLARVEPMEPVAAAEDEDFWNWIREQYTTSPNLVNLNNGGVSPQPIPVQEAHIRYYKMCNEAPSYFMWRIIDQGREPMRAKLADLAGCSPDEIAVNRNSTEGLNSIIFGLNLKAGDEVVVCKYDYPSMINAYKQREKRDGIKVVWVDLDLPVENDKDLVAKFEAAITPKTKIVHLTHVINYTGQVLPCRKIADMAHSKGCEVIVDGAHSFAHIDFKIPDLGCDYFATSLHKWLCAPFGTGMMYVKKNKIKNIWALLSSTAPDSDDIHKFESIGTRSNAAEMAISNAVDFHLLVGSRRKEERLRYLKNYWCEKASRNPKVKLYTSMKSNYACALATFGIEGWKPEDIDAKLFEKKKIIVTSINHENVHGVRVTPHIYTSLRDLDRLVDGINEIADMEPPKKS